MTNLLTQPLLHIDPGGPVTLPGAMAALARDAVDGFPALRPHQEPAWHMFLVQLAALALDRAGTAAIPEDEAGWAAALRGLTPEHDDDAPWCLVVEDPAKPAFLQPPIPAGVNLPADVATPDALDLLITSKNHDLKRTIARDGTPQDWVFALVSLQTGEGFGGAGNQGVARMNGGSSSRPMLSLAPLPTDHGKALTPRPGARFRRDVTVLLETRQDELRRYEPIGYPETGGLGLTWLAPWPEGTQLRTRDLDLWFIEVCRRVRLREADGALTARRGTSKATRIDAKPLKGAVGDPFAPTHKTEGKSLTLGGRDFGYRLLTELLLSGNWEMPVLARPGRTERRGETLALVAAALARGNSKTEGFKSRILPVGGKLMRATLDRRDQLHTLALQQIAEIDVFNKALGVGLAIVAAKGDGDGLKKEHYARAADARQRFDRVADALFFDSLWARFEAQATAAGAEAVSAARTEFARALLRAARREFETALPTVPCAGLFRPRAQARGRAAFEGILYTEFGDLTDRSEQQEDEHAA